MAQVTTLAAKDVSSEWNRAALTGHCQMGGPSPRADSNALSSQPSSALPSPRSLVLGWGQDKSDSARKTHLSAKALVKGALLGFNDSPPSLSRTQKWVGFSHQLCRSSFTHRALSQVC